MTDPTTDSFPLATEFPFTGNDGSDTAPGAETGVDAGASGPTGYDDVHISTGAMVAIIVIVCIVAVLGVSTAFLFYQAKKREWTVRETLRRSARKVVTALTPRSRTEFPRELKDPKDDVPPTPGIRPDDIEKGKAKAASKRLEESQRKKGFGRK